MKISCEKIPEQKVHCGERVLGLIQNKVQAILTTYEHVA